MTKILEPWRWPIAVVLSVALASLAALFLLGPQLGVDPETLGDVRRWLAGGAAALGALLLPALKAWLTADSDGDGKPDWMDKTPTGPRDTLVALLVAGSLVLGVGTLQGCGSKADQHRTLNWITRVGDPSYELVVKACDEMRDYVVDREGHTEQEDRALMGEINGVCDRAVASFEVLIHTQHGARAAIEAGVEGVAIEAIARALAIWRELQAVVDGIEVRNARTAGGEA